MTPECAKHYRESLERDFNKTFDSDKLRLLWPEMKKEPDRAMEGAYNFINKSGNFPTVEGFLKIIQVEGRKVRMKEAVDREEEYEREKAARGKGSFLTEEQRTEYGQSCRKIYDLATPMKMHAMGYVEAVQPDKEALVKLVSLCEIMATGFPNERAGWDDLKSHFVKMGLA